MQFCIYYDLSKVIAQISTFIAGITMLDCTTVLGDAHSKLKFHALKKGVLHGPFFMNYDNQAEIQDVVVILCLAFYHLIYP